MCDFEAFIRQAFEHMIRKHEMSFQVVDDRNCELRSAKSRICLVSRKTSFFEDFSAFIGPATLADEELYVDWLILRAKDIAPRRYITIPDNAVLNNEEKFRAEIEGTATMLEQDLSDVIEGNYSFVEEYERLNQVGL